MGRHATADSNGRVTVGLLFIIGVLFVGVAVALVLRVVALPHIRVAAQVRQIGTYGFNQELREKEEKTGLGLSAGIAERIGRAVAARLPSLKPLERRELMAAGIYGLSDERVHGYRVLAGLGLPAIILGLSFLGAGSLSFLTIMMAIVVAAIGWFLPAAMIRTRGQRRLNRIDRDLPELIDVLTATIEAGLGVGGSLQLVSDRFEGPLGAELRLTLQEQAMGLSTEAALTNMLARADTPSVRSFVRAVSQGDSLGVSIASMLRNLAVETRKRRRALARERAQRAPVKLLFPLIFLIFPALLIVLMYPTLHRFLLVLGQ
jgi:tight adherence protein C